MAGSIPAAVLPRALRSAHLQAMPPLAPAAVGKALQPPATACAGTKQERYLDQNIAAASIRLTPQEMRAIEAAVPHTRVGPGAA